MKSSNHSILVFRAKRRGSHSLTAARRPPNKKQQETPKSSKPNPFPSLWMPNACAKSSFVSLQAPCRLVIKVYEGAGAHFFVATTIHFVSTVGWQRTQLNHLPAGTTMMMIKMAMPMPSQIRIFMSCDAVSTQNHATKRIQVCLPSTTWPCELGWRRGESLGRMLLNRRSCFEEHRGARHVETPC